MSGKDFDSLAPMTSPASSGPDGILTSRAASPVGSLPSLAEDPPRSARWHLREATDASHRSLDAALSRFDLSDAGDYRRFLAIHAMVLPPLEGALARADFERSCRGWRDSGRGRALRKDLVGLGIEPVVLRIVPRVSVAGAWGVAYVLEGSRLGGKILARRVAAGGEPLAIGNARFLSCASILPWPRFVERLEEALASRCDLGAAIEGARMAFAMFEDALERVGDGASWNLGERS